LIFIKISDNDFIIVINLKGKKVHTLEFKNGEIINIFDDINEIRLSYIFEIINPNEVNSISNFQ